jgi:hypothetical protein
MPGTFNRFWKVASRFQAGTMLLDNSYGHGLRMTWSVDRHLTGEPDRGVVRVANLNPSVVKKIRNEWRQAQGLAVGSIVDFNGSIFAGFDGASQLLMFADVYDIVEDDRSERSTTWTEFKLGDGMLGIQNGQLNSSLGDVDLNTMFNLITNSMNLTTSAETKAVFAEKYAGSRVAQFNNGVIMQGPSRELLNELCGLLKVRWTVTNGKLQLVPIGRAIPGDAIVLSPRSGLLSYSASKDGTISCSAHGLPAAVPGRQLLVQDEFGKLVAEPLYRVESVKFSGDSTSYFNMQVVGRKAVLA